MKKLAYFLNYELSTTLLFFLSWLGPIIAIISSIIFTPYMLHILYKEKKYGWIMFFAIIVIIPTLLNFTNIESMLFKNSINLIILGIVYLYYFILRLCINDWIEEERSKRQRILESRNENQENELFNEMIK